MKSTSATLIGAVLFLAAVTLAQPLAAQNVTWGATGLPPGLTISSVDGKTGKISGTPTAAGIYEAIIYPLANGMAGDMRTLKFSILPAGANVPVYYSYERRGTQDTPLFALAGGGGRILVGRTDNWNPSGSQIKELLTTTNGIAFASRPSPAGIPIIKAAAISGNRTIVIGRDSGAAALLAASSDSPTGSFTNLVLPATTATGGADGFLFADSARFFLGVVENSFSGSTPAANLRLWIATNTAANGSGAWVQRLTTLLSNEYLYNVRFDFAQNAATRVLSAHWDDVPQKLFVSTNSGTAWTPVTNPGIMWLAYGGGNFVGSGNGGIWKSADGTTWAKVSSQFAGRIIFSAKLGLFFSDYLGTSKDAVSWQLFGPGGGMVPDPAWAPPWVDNGTGVVFKGASQYSSTFVPWFEDSSSHSGSVNTPMNFTVVVTP